MEIQSLLQHIVTNNTNKNTVNTKGHKHKRPGSTKYIRARVCIVFIVQSDGKKESVALCVHFRREIQNEVGYIQVQDIAEHTWGSILQ